MKNCSIIGGGIGGLTSAIYLAKSGYAVDLFEQEDLCGGKALDHRGGGFRFDGGPTLLTMPFVLDLIADETGIPVEQRPEIKPLEETCRYFYPDKSVFHAYTDRHMLYEEISRNMTDSPQQMAEYLSYVKRIYDLCSELFVFSSFHEFDVLMSNRDLMKMNQLIEIDPFRTMHTANRSFFKDKRLVQYADRYATYSGSNPYRVPGTLNIIHHVEQLGASVPSEGIAALPQFLQRAAVNAGVRIYTGIGVKKINLERSSVKSLTTDAGEVPCRRIISNVDVSMTYKKLMPGHYNADLFKYDITQSSLSAMVFYWGMKICQDKLAVHNILFSADYRREFRKLFGSKRFPDDPTVYIYISSGYKASDAPEGHENWYVMINAPRIAGQYWAKEIERARTAVKRRILEELDIDVDEHLVYEDVFTPEQIEKRTGSYQGSLYGISSNNMFAAFFRQGNRSKRFGGLYFCGGSAHPGAGMPLSMLSGRTAAGILKRRDG